MKSIRNSRQCRNRSRFAARRRRAVFLERLEDRHLLAGVPDVALALPGEQFIGEDFSFTATFDNVAAGPTDVGYGPFIDLTFPVNGNDGAAGTDVPDGISFLNANYLGAPLTTTVLTFPDDGGGVGTVEHPYAVDSLGDPLTVSGTAGDQLVVLQLPFGSFTPDQPAAAVTVNARLSNLADVAVPLTVTGRGGFQFGCDPLDNPMTDPSILTPGSTSPDSSMWAESGQTTPTLLTLTKTYLGPEDETATGPNFPRQYQITVDIADGQTITDFDIVDDLDNTMAFLSVDSTTSVTPGTVFTFPSGLPPVGVPLNGNQLLINADTVTGGPGSADLDVIFRFYIPEFDADGVRVIPLNGDDPTLTTDTASGVGDWVPLDPRDPAAPDNAVGGPSTHDLQNKSIAIQKSFQVVSGGDPTPGTIVEFTLDFQISDYYTFGDLILDDTFSDGLDWLATFAPTFQVTDQDGNVSGTFTLGSDLTHTVNPDGTETLDFDLSAAMIAAAAPDGIVRGGLATAPDGDDSSPAAAAVGTIVFRTIISQDYDQLPPSGLPPISQGDALTNDVDISGTVRDNDMPGVIIGPAPDGREGDDSSAGGTIPVGTLSKSIYAVNGNTGVGSTPLIAPGDSVTYSLEYTHPISTFVNFELFDFLPLPVFKVDDPDADGTVGPVWSFVVDANPNNAPAPGVVEFGPNDTFFALSGASAGPDFFSPPQLSIDVPSNELRLFYGDYDDPANQTSTVHLLFTVTTADDPFADGLFLTNQVRSLEANSHLEASTEDSIVQIQLGQPELNITKGVVATDGPAAAFAPSPPVAAPLTISPPGSAGARLAGGTLSSNYLAATPLDSNLADIDAGDLVTFSIVLENTGSSRRGAFDVQLRDTLPAGFRIPTAAESPAQLNLHVADGTGAAIPFTNLGSGLFDPAGGIELTDPGPTPEQPDGSDGGALDAFNPTNGRNVAVVTYDLVTDVSVNPLEVLENTATLFNYAGAPGGGDHTAEDLVDEAQVSIIAPAVDKTITATNQPHTAGNDVAIGEIVTYEVEITIPEGTSNNVTLEDRLDRGLAVVGINSITASAGVTTDVPGGFPAVAAGVIVTNVGAGDVNQGRQLTLDFGNVVNADTDNGVTETIVVSYDVVVINSDNNNRGGRRNNRADWRWEDDFGPQQVRDNAPNVTIVEPTLQVNKTAMPLLAVEAGDTVTYTINVSHTGPSDADAFDVDLEDILPPHTAYVPASLQHTGGLAPDLLLESGGTVTANWSSFPDGSTSQIQFDVTILTSAVAGTFITNEADVDWTSLPGDVTVPQSVYNTLSTERTGDDTDPGGTANDYLTSDPASVFVRLPVVLAKKPVSTSEPSTPTNQVTIGEIVRYELQTTIAAGTNTEFRIVDRLPDGLELIDVSEAKLSFTSDNPILAAPDLLGANNSAVPPTFVIPPGRISGTQTITFDLGTLINVDTDADFELVTIEFNALVLNTADTNNGDTKTNVFDLYVGGELVETSGPANVIILEPSITDVDKQIIGTPPADAQDPVTYQVTYSNTGTTTAFDVRLLDPLNPALLNLALPPTVVLGSGASGVNDNSAGSTIDITIDEVPVGGTVSVTYMATLTGAVEPSQIIPNTADVTYTSLPGTGTVGNPTGSQTPGASGAPNGERDGSGGPVNDYADNDSEAVQIIDPTFTKTLIATNQPHTTGLDVAIGEIVTYETVITVPEGTMPGTQVIDTPDTGLAIVAVDSIVPSNANVTTSIPGGFAQVVANANASIPVSGDSLTIDLATVTNADNDADAETITITYRAVVLNTFANGRGFQLNNATELTWSQGTLAAQAQDVTIVEPTLQVNKLNGDPILGDAGDTITFELEIAHSPVSDADAFDVDFSDLIDSLANKMTYVPGSVSVSNFGGAVLSGPVDETGGDLSIQWSDFPLAATSTITFDVTLDITVGLNEILVNTADLAWTGLPGDVTTPQSSNPYSVERTGDAGGPGEPGANDYRDMDDGLVGTPSLDFSKEVVDTSEPSTGTAQHAPLLTDATIGEYVTYGLIVTLPDGTFPNVVVADNLPTLDSSEGVLEFVTASLGFVGSDITDGVGSPLVLPPPVLSDTNADGVNDRIVFNMGTIRNAIDANGITDDDTFVIALETRVLNTLPDTTVVNFDGDTLTNLAEITATGLPVPLTDSVDIEVVEPDLEITKETNTVSVDGGDTVTFTLTVDHTAASTSDAFDVSITDVLPSGLTYAGNINVLSGAGPAVTQAGQTLTFAWTEILLGDPTYQFTFDVTVDASVTPGQTFLNVADLEWSTLPGPDAGERTYTDSDPADLISSTTTALNPVKSLVSTSEPSTSGNDTAVGEVVRYRLQFEVTEGTLPNLRMIDTLDPGLQLVDTTQVFVSFTSDVPMGAGADLLGANNGDIPPTHLLSAGRITTVGQQVFFDLGEITNFDDDANSEFITLEYNVLVNNTVDTNDGDVLNNSFLVDLDGTPIGPQNPGDNTVAVNVVEPSIDDVQKSVVSFTGDRVTYQVTFSSSGSTTAYDARLLDSLPAQLTLDTGSVAVSLLGGATGADTSNSTATTVDVRIDEMPVGSSVVVTYTAVLNVNGQTVSNTADVTYTSLPGANGTPNNPTGSQPPGAPGATDGERNGSGGVNDYVDADSELLGSLGDFVWHDLDGDGVQDVGEPGLDGITVNLVWPGGNGIFGDGDDVSLTTVTSGGGAYSFSGLPAGTFRVAVDLGTVPAGFVNTYDLDGNLNSATEVGLTAGQNRTDVDFGYAESATAGGIKWNDANANGVQDGGEGPLSGVTIFADLNNDGVFGPGEPSDVTNAAGAYQLAGLRPGTVTIREVPPVGFYQTFPANFAPHTVNLVPGQTAADLNFGNTPSTPIVINDFDPEFILDSGEWIRYPDCDGHWNGDATVAPPGIGEATARWVFTGLEPGQYRVSATWVANPDGATNTPFTVLGGPTAETVRVDQMVSPSTYPNSFSEGGVPWMDLDPSYQILGNTLTVEISNDANGFVVADAIRIERIINPEIVVSQGAMDITDGVTSIAYNPTTVGAPVTLTYTVENQGGTDLHLAEPIEVPAGFTVVNSFGQTTLAPQQTTTFEVRLDANRPGLYGGDVVFYNSDNDENPFSFAVTGNVATGVIDDGDPGFVPSGGWTSVVGEGYQNDVTYSAAGSGSDTATWRFTGLTPGTVYQVATTWTTNANRATNAPFTMTGGATPLTTTVNQQLAPGDLMEAGTAWEILGDVTVTGSTLDVQLSDAANGFVIADAVRLIPLMEPDVGVAVDGSPVTAGVTTVDFGPTLVGLPVQKTFTVSNDGNQVLTLVEPIAVPSGFLVSPFGQTVLNPGQTTTFTVTLPATTAGSYSGLVSFASDDPDENPFNFTVAGEVYITPPPLILDDGDSDFSTTGSWVPFTSAGYQGDARYAFAGTGSAVSTWSFTIPAPGIYRVSATWVGHPNRATNAPYSVDGNAPVLIDQRAAPNDFIEAGTAWEDLGNFTIAGTTFDVTLSNNANGFVIADAIRIERIGSPEIRVTVDRHIIADESGVLDLGSFRQGETVSREFVVTNIGTEPLVLDLANATGNFTVSQFGQYTLAPEASTTFTIGMDTSTPGTYSGQVSFLNNDPDEADFEFSLLAEVTMAPQVVIVDNGDPGFSLSGSWTSYGSGFQQDLLYSAAGSGNDATTWDFTELTPGGYRVAATWVPHSNRGTTVPFAVNGLDPVLVNQRLAPAGINDEGVAWQVLGDFFTDGDRITVAMSDKTNGYVIADAIRIERILDTEIVVYDENTAVVDGQTTTEFGSTIQGAPVSKTFTVANAGALPLSLSGPIQVPSGFTASSFGQTLLAAGASTTFTVTLDAATLGNFSGQLSFTTSDADEGIFNFDLTGTVASAAQPQIIDDGSVGFQRSYGWTRYAGVGREGDVHYAGPGSGSYVASWTFEVPVAGDYVVSASWVPHPNRATNAPYRLYNGTAAPANLLSTTRVNQELSPTADFQDAGTAFQNLSVVSVTGTTLTVTLANDANQYVIADAVRIEFVEPLRAASAGQPTEATGNSSLTVDQVASLLPAAIELWETAGLSAAETRLLQNVNVSVVDLPGTMLGGATSAGLLLDADAAGWGWQIGASPRLARRGLGLEEPGKPRAGIDLLHVIGHELGHVLGYTHDDHDNHDELEMAAGGFHPTSLMAGLLVPGRSTPRHAPPLWSPADRTDDLPADAWPFLRDNLADGDGLADGGDDPLPARHDESDDMTLRERIFAELEAGDQTLMSLPEFSPDDS